MIIVVIYRKIKGKLGKVFVGFGAVGRVLALSINILAWVLSPTPYNPEIAWTTEKQHWGDIFEDDQNFILVYAVSLRLVWSNW